MFSEFALSLFNVSCLSCFFFARLLNVPRARRAVCPHVAFFGKRGRVGNAKNAQRVTYDAVVGRNDANATPRIKQRAAEQFPELAHDSSRSIEKRSFFTNLKEDETADVRTVVFFIIRKRSDGASSKIIAARKRRRNMQPPVA